MIRSDRVSIRPICFRKYVRDQREKRGCWICKSVFDCIPPQEETTIAGDKAWMEIPYKGDPDASKRANEEPIKKRAPDFLQAALSHMQDRAKTYDKPDGERSMVATVAAFNAATGHALSETQGWLFMVFLKAIRTQQGAFRSDNYEDGAAYFGLMGESAIRARELEK